MSGEAFTVAAARLATFLYAAALAIRLSARGSPGWKNARVVWTAACLVYLAHVYGAFEFIHHWSHAAAYEETARQTEALFGFLWGGGIYFNYLFTVIWLADVAWWWSDNEGYRRRARWLTVAVHAFLAFMFFNGAVVFASGPVRWFGLAAALILLLLWRRSRP